MSQELLQNLSANGVLHLTMNRPEVHNAFDDHQVIRLTQALEDASANDDVRVVILGSVGKSFSAGGDLNYMRRMGENDYAENLVDAGRLATLMKTLYFLPQPTIAKVQGAVFGGGVGLVSCCDFAVGSDRAKFSTSEVKVGMAPATIAPYIVRTIGEKASRRMFMSGELIQAERAHQLGFLSHLVEEDALGSAAEELAQSLLANAPSGVRKAKCIATDVAAGDVNDAMIEHTVRFVADIRESEEGREGLNAFLGKRTPAWVS